MINETEHLLICLAEECAEVQQRATKALRFGLAEIQPGQEFTNAQRIVGELLDLYVIAELLNDSGVIDMETKACDKQIAAKKSKLETFMAYAESVGVLSRIAPAPNGGERG